MGGVDAAILANVAFNKGETVKQAATNGYHAAAAKHTDILAKAATSTAVCEILEIGSKALDRDKEVLGPSTMDDFSLPPGAALPQKAWLKLGALRFQLDDIFALHRNNVRDVRVNVTQNIDLAIGALDASLNSALDSVLRETVDMRVDFPSDEFFYLLAKMIKQCRDCHLAEQRQERAGHGERKSDTLRKDDEDRKKVMANLNRETS